MISKCEKILVKICVVPFFVIVAIAFVGCAENSDLTLESISLEEEKAANDTLFLDAVANSSEDYLALDAGDTLTIDVWGQSDLSKSVTIDSSGHIYYPFIGKVKASGITVEELQDILFEKLSYYYVDPVVIVTPVELEGRKYYVLGEVHQPGKYIINAQTSILEAVATAGGASDDARDIIVLLRKKGNKLLIVSIPLHFDDLTDKNIASVTMRIQQNDILYLAPSNIANVERFMNRLNNILNPLLSLERGVLYWPALVNAIEGSSGEILVQ